MNPLRVCTLALLVLLSATPASAQSPTPVQLDRSIVMDDQAFGRSLALDGLVAVVGAPNEDDAQFNLEVGAAYIYRHDGTTWVEEARVASGSGTSFNVFGTAVAVSGDVVAVSEPNSDLAGTNTGSVFIYRYTGGSWTLEDTIESPTAPARDEFGTAIALDGNVLAVGATSADGAQANSGAVFMYRYDGATWQPEGSVSSTNPGPQDLYGASVAVDGDRMVVGAFNANDSASNQAGLLYVYAYDGTAWNETAILQANDSNSIANMGVSVDIDGDWIVAGAHLHNALGGGSGAAYVFRHDGQQWAFHEKLLASDGAGFYLFGIGVSISQGRMLVGAENWGPPGGDSTGKVYLFTYDETGDSWSETDSFTPADLVRASQMGHAVAINGDAMLMGAPEWDGAEAGMGAVYAVGVPRVATSVASEQPTNAFLLDPAYPNPFRHTTTLTLSTTAEGPATARLYDTLGREVRTVFDGRLPAGSSTRLQVDAAGLPGGVYLIRVEGAGGTATRRLVVVQ